MAAESYADYENNTWKDLWCDQHKWSWSTQPYIMIVTYEQVSLVRQPQISYSGSLSITSYALF